MASRKTKRDQIVALKVAGIPTSSIMKQLSVCRKTIYNTWKRHQDGETTESKPIPGRKRTVCTPEVVEAVKMHIRSNPQISIRKTAKEMNISPTSAKRIIRGQYGTKKSKSKNTDPNKKKKRPIKPKKEEVSEVQINQEHQSLINPLAHQHSDQAVLNTLLPINIQNHMHPHPQNTLNPHSIIAPHTTTTSMPMDENSVGDYKRLGDLKMDDTHMPAVSLQCPPKEEHDIHRFIEHPRDQQYHMAGDIGHCVWGRIIQPCPSDLDLRNVSVQQPQNEHTNYHVLQ